MSRITSLLAISLVAASSIHCGDAITADPTNPALEPDQPQASVTSIPATPTGFSAPFPETMVRENCGVEQEYCGGTLNGDSVDWISSHAVGGPDYADIMCKNGNMFTVFSDSENRNCLDCENECYNPSRFDGWDACETDRGNLPDTRYACAYRPGALNGDCVAYTCPAGYEISEDHSDYYTTPRYKEPECVPIDPDPELVLESISGPTQIVPDETNCTWTAHVEGGSGSYSYNWFSDGTYVGSGPSWTGGVLEGDMDTSFTLSVHVYDSGETAFGSVFVSENVNGTSCSGGFPKGF